jgi:hypothetical protein
MVWMNQKSAGYSLQEFVHSVGKVPLFVTDGKEIPRRSTTPSTSKRLDNIKAGA